MPLPAKFNKRRGRENYEFLGKSKKVYRILEI